MNRWLSSHKILLQTILVFVLVIMPLASVYADGAVEKFIYNNIVLPFFGLFVKIGAGVFNYVVNTFVINFGVFFQNSGIGIAIDATWVFVRDLMNLTFIFGLVYIGFKMILNSDDSQSRRWLASLIIAAIFINFSLYFTKFVVDISNFVATEILDAAVGQQLLVTGADSRDGYTTGVDLATAFMQQMQLVTVTSGGNINNPQILITEKAGNVGFGYIIGTAILLSVAGFVFLSSALLFLGRTISLILYMIFSPLLFVGMIFPALSSKASEHTRKFLSAAFFAPLYAALLYINLALINAIVGPQGSINLGATLLQEQSDNVTEFGTSMAVFILVCGLLLATLDVAKKLGIIGAESTLKARRYLGKNIKGAAAGVPLRGLNRASQAGLNAYDRMGNSKAGRFTRGALAVGTLGLVSSKNVRSTLNSGTKASVLDSETLDAKQTRQKNERKAATSASDKAKRDKDRKTGTDTERAAAVRDMSADELARIVPRILGDKMTPEIAKSITDAQLKAMRDSGALNGDQIKKVEELREQGSVDPEVEKIRDDQTTTQELTNAMKELGKIIKGMSGDRAQAMGIDRLEKEEIAFHISDSQIESWEKENKFTPDEISRIKTARTNAQTRMVRTGSLANANNVNAQNDPAFQEEQRAALFNRSAQDLGKMPIDLYKEVQSYDHITPAILEQRLRNGVKPNDLVGIKQALAGHLGIGVGQRPSTVAGLEDSPWTKWETGNSIYAAQFFN